MLYKRFHSFIYIADAVLVNPRTVKFGEVISYFGATNYYKSDSARLVYAFHNPWLKLR